MKIAQLKSFVYDALFRHGLITNKKMLPGSAQYPVLLRPMVYVTIEMSGNES
ncbi:Uncharacterised protein [Salmonella enterica subsp. arizonae]|uniref:Uncharacterized protein n=1 Tax=Salmonella enterica subsp. arizonae TaxID=59203 RepID=A0A379T6M0_SALER|nr:Uncharacterised protein [Salmonella enterica subsp. arizonae]